MEEISLTPNKIFQKTEEEEHFPIHFIKLSLPYSHYGKDNLGQYATLKNMQYLKTKFRPIEANKI